MTPTQMKMARHALGLPNDNKRSYRNRYCASDGTDVAASWDDMVKRGLAGRTEVRGRMIEFHLTRNGAKIAIDPSENLDPEDFPS